MPNEERSERSQAGGSEDEVVIPSPFVVLFGERTRRLDLAVVLVGALLATGALALSCRAALSQLSVGRLVLLLALALDLFGGALANLTPGTIAFWRARGGRWRAGFVLVHGGHVLALAWALPEAVIPIAVAWAWMLAASAVLALVGPGRLSMALALIGAALLSGLPGSSPLVCALLTVYLLKLVHAFGGAHARAPARGGET